jgi:hypothetical protein
MRHALLLRAPYSAGAGGALGCGLARRPRAAIQRAIT